MCSYACKPPLSTSLCPLGHLIREPTVPNRRVFVHFHLLRSLSQQVFHRADIARRNRRILPEMIVDEESEFGSNGGRFCVRHPKGADDELSRESKALEQVQVLTVCKEPGLASAVPIGGEPYRRLRWVSEPKMAVRK